MVKRYSRLIYYVIFSAIMFSSFSYLYADIDVKAPIRKMPGFFDAFLEPKVWVAALLALLGAWLLNKSKVTQKIRFVSLGVMFFTFGILSSLPLGSISKSMGLHPSPLCTVTKPWLFINAGRGYPLIFAGLLATIIILTIVVNKAFCGWVCPIGALQEIVFRLPLLRKMKRMINFRIANSIRISLFVLFFVGVFALGKEIYEWFNPFEPLHWSFEIYGMIVLLALITASLFFFRPFCYAICPLGLITWVFEHISIFRVRFNKEKCSCPEVCVTESYCPAVKPIMEEKKIKPDCFSCGKCMEVCPSEALKFSCKK